MSIVSNERCPECAKKGRDKTSNHLMVFEDGSRYCPRADIHEGGIKYYVQGNGDYIKELVNSEIDGTTKYTINQFRELNKAGKLNDPVIRALALSGMRQKDRWEVSNDEEREAMLVRAGHDLAYFNKLPVRNLRSRGIRGDVCRRFDVHVGVNDGAVISHYYPVHNLDGTLRGAKCRTLPKDFRYDTLGFTWGKTALFGQVASQADFAKGARKKKLLLVGGEPDAMAGWQMLTDADTSGKYFYHVWSVVHGEKAMEDILNNRDAINQFDEIIAGFDADAVGQQTNLEISRMFRGKVKFLTYPTGCKDANQCLLEGRAAEFVDAWFNPSEERGGQFVKAVSEMADAAKKTPEMGQQWPWPKFNKITIGIRENMLFVYGAGPGVGKTHFTKEVIFHAMEMYNETVGVIYLEEPPIKTLRNFAGRYLGNKRIDLPPNDPDDPDSWIEEREYTEAEANEAIDKLASDGRLFIADTKGDKSIEAVMKCVDEMMALGIRKIVIDNLTAITHPKAGSKVDAIDETMKQIGTYKDENPCTIFLISHLKRVGGEGSNRTPHTHGGEVYESDFRGSGAITMWSNYCFGIERNVMADNDFDKRMTTLRCVKDRDFGLYTGHTVKLFGNPETGRLEQYDEDLHSKFRIPSTLDGDTEFE